MTVFELRYTPDTIDGYYITISLHRTKLGAEEAKCIHQQKKMHQNQMMVSEGIEDIECIGLESWKVVETKIKD